MALIDEIKPVLRFSASTTAFDGEITDLISAARQDLISAGVEPTMAEAESAIDPLIKRAIITYVKANFGWDNPDAERLQQSYDLLKMHLTLSQDYTPVVI